MTKIHPNGSPAPSVAFAPSPAFSDGWPGGPQAILFEIAGALLLWFVLKRLFNALNRPRRA